MRSHRHRIGGLAIVLVGAVLFITGVIEVSRPAAERAGDPLIGRSASAPVICIVGGLSATLLGFVVVAFGRAASAAAHTNLSEVHRRPKRVAGKK